MTNPSPRSPRSPGARLVAALTSAIAMVLALFAAACGGRGGGGAAPVRLVSIAITPATPALALGFAQALVATGTYSDMTTADLTTSVLWSSADPAIAAVDNAAGTQGLATGLGVGATTVTATDVASGVAGSTTFTVTPAVLVSLAVTPATPSLALGYSQQFTATGTFSDNTTQDLTTAVTWTSSTPATATVSNTAGSEGLATSAAVGTTTITATETTTTIAGSTTLTVTPAVLVSVAVTPDAPSLALGYSQQFTATGTFSDNTTQDLTTAVTWTSSTPATATISNVQGSQGLATSATVGTTTIAATEPTTTIAGSTTLTVTAAVLVSLAVTPTTPSIALGYGQQFTATGTFSDSTTQDLTTAVTWTSSTPATATISNAQGSHGLATSAAAGTTTITATDPATSIADSTTLTVTPAVLISVAVTPATPSLALGYSQQFTATGTFSDNSTQDLTTTVTWSSSTPATATVSNAQGSHGLATSAAVGTTTIAATDPATSIAGSTTLTVTNATLASIAVTPALPSVALGYSQQFTATGTFSDNSTQDLTTTVTWSSSTPATATISNAQGSHGLATSSATGTTTIAATDPATSIAGSTTLTVTPAVLVSVAVTPATPSVALGYSQQFTATGTFSDSTTQDLTASVTWSSSTPATATISNAAGSHGLATSSATGTTTIAATDPATSIAGSTVFAVTPAVLVSIAVTPALPSVALGYSQQFTATGTLSDNTTQDLTASVTWSSSTPATATISNAQGSEGLASTVGTGTTTIAATDPATSIAGSTVFTVTPAVLVAVAVTPALPSVALGYSQQFTATGTFSDNTTLDVTASVTWSSSTPATATISNAQGSQGLASSVGTGTTTIAATEPSTSIAGSTVFTVTPAVLVSIAVTPPAPSVALGFSQQFTATGTFSDNTTQDLTASVTWSSSTPATATISNAQGSEGLASTVGTGTTTIAATEPSTSIAGSTVFTVTPAVLATIKVLPASPSLPLGYSQQFTATGTLSDGTTQDLTASVTWSSSTPATATISNAQGSHGLASSAALGVTTITATEPTTSITDSTVLTVSSAVLVALAVSPVTPSVVAGYSQQFAATGTFSDSSTRDVTVNVTWSSSNTAVATISNAQGSQGRASTVGGGTTTITATDPMTSVVDSTTLTVTAATLVSIAVTPAAPSVTLGFTQQFTATGTFSNSSTQDLTGVVTWSSSSPAVATISNAQGSKGLASTASTGTTTIIALDPGTSIAGSTSMSVTTAVLVALNVTPVTTTVALGQGQQYTCTGIFSDSSTQDLTASVNWSTSNAGIATVSNVPASKGFATSVAQGTATITAAHTPSGLTANATLTVGEVIVVRQTTSTGTPSGTLNLTLATPQYTSAGEVMLAVIAIRPRQATVLAPAGWTLIRRSNGSNPNPISLISYRKVAAAGEPANHTWSFSQSQGATGAILTFQGVNAASPVNSENGQGTNSSLTHTTQSINTNATNTLVVTLHSMGASATWTPPAGMTEAIDIASNTVPNALGVCMLVSWQFKPATGATGQRTATASNDASSGNAAIIALRR